MDLVVQSRTSCSPRCRTSGLQARGVDRPGAVPARMPITRVDLPTNAADREAVWGRRQWPLRPSRPPRSPAGHPLLHRGPPQRRVASQHLSNRLETVGITTHIRLWSDGERWREFNTGQTGLQTQATAERIAAATVLTGAAQPAANRASLAALHGR